MGKQRTPQGQRPGRRGPVPRVPAAPGVAEAPSEAITQAEPAMNQDNAEQNAPQAEAETLEAASAAAEAPAEAASEEPAAATQTEADAEPAAAELAVAAAPPEEPAAEEELAASEAEHAEEPALEAAPSEPLLPVAAFAAASPAAVIAAEPPAPARTTFRFAFAPARIDVEGIGVVLANYVHNESVAALSHMRALSTARSPAEMIRLNVTEMQRAADASLTCWSDIARRAARSVPLH